MLIVLVDHDVFKSVPLDERADKLRLRHPRHLARSARVTSRPEPLRLAG